MPEKIILGSDHAGFKLKEAVKKMLNEMHIPYEDVGTNSEEPCDYPENAKKVAQKVQAGEGRGIVMCGTGLGESIVANKFKGIRATVCTNQFMAEMAREHNNSNVLCLGARVLSEPEALEIAAVWLETGFSDEERHKRRVDQINKIDSEQCK